MRTAKAATEAALDKGQREADGAQSIHRAIDIIRLISASPADGMKLVDIAEGCGLSHPTAYRILRALESEGVVERAGDSKRYVIGTEVAWLGLKAAQRFPIAALAAPALDRASIEVGDTLLLSVRSGDFSVCVERRAGRFPIPVTVAAVGARLPLNTTPAGRTMLAFMSPRGPRPKLAAALDDGPGSEVAQTRLQGYLVSDGLTVRDTKSVTVPIFDAGGHAIAALSAITAANRLHEERLASVVSALSTCARATSGALVRHVAERAMAGAS
ncbi:IclR family transcriptional regulator [Devosia sp. Root635]|uniref:IclR family transcriptional regulator n=1 Tax=Devosia sp. Root635 TaxID=1736575 RepID=UPI000A63C5CF|nr:IclR family transcriptional regulator [Devosia sp. Root635]